MSMMRALVWQEWRDQRRVSLVMTAIAMLACVAVYGLEPRQYNTGLVAGLVLPSLIALFLGLTGTDLLVSSERGGRAHMHFLLPISPLKVWASKVLYLFITGIGFAAVLASFNVLLIADRSVGFGGIGAGTFRHIAPSQVSTWMMVCVLVFVATVLFFSSLLQRKSVAVWCAALSFGAFAYLAVSVEGSEFVNAFLADVALVWAAWIGPGFILGILAMTLVLALAAGSLAGFRPEWALEGRVLRRAIRVVAVGVFPLFVGSAAAAFSVAAFTSIEPYGRFTQVVDLAPSPGGGRVAVFVQWGLAEYSYSEDRLGSVFVIDVESGKLEALPVFGVWPYRFWEEVWLPDDTVHVSRRVGWSKYRARFRLDLHTGDLLPQETAALLGESPIEATILKGGNRYGQGSRIEYLC